jgi:hypothetical protein
MVTDDDTFLMRALDRETFKSMANANIILVGNSDTPMKMFNLMKRIQIIGAPKSNSKRP